MVGGVQEGIQMEVSGYGAMGKGGGGGGATGNREGSVDFIVCSEVTLSDHSSGHELRENRDALPC